jgi:hypothetical protein
VLTIAELMKPALFVKLRDRINNQPAALSVGIMITLMHQFVGVLIVCLRQRRNNEFIKYFFRRNPHPALHTPPKQGPPNSPRYPTYIHYIPPNLR